VRLTTFFFQLAFTGPRGISEREWGDANPEGTRAEFNQYFKNLSNERLQVRRTVASDDFTNTALQELQRQAEAKVV